MASLLRYSFATKRTHHKYIEFYDPSLLETLSCGFMTSGSSGGVDKGAIDTGSNSPSKINIENYFKTSSF